MAPQTTRQAPRLLSCCRLWVSFLQLSSANCYLPLLAQSGAALTSPASPDHTSEWCLSRRRAEFARQSGGRGTVVANNSHAPRQLAAKWRLLGSLYGSNADFDRTLLHCPIHTAFCITIYPCLCVQSLGRYASLSPSTLLSVLTG